jgi:ferredoxin
MPHVVCQPCYDCKYTDCAVPCPVECFYQDEHMLYIHPEDCINCEACVSECPVEAIFLDTNVPARWKSFIELNAERATALKESCEGHINTQQEALRGPGCGQSSA